MRRIALLIALLTSLAGVGRAQTYIAKDGYCELGGQTVTTDGRTSTTKVQRSFVSCTITVYETGTTTLASIASNNSGTPKSNPFTADSDGYFKWYALAGTYDIKFSGSGIATPFTRSGYTLAPSSGGGGSGITGSGTANRVAIFTSSTAIGDSVFKQTGTSELGFAATGKRINLDTGSQQVVEFANASITGTTSNRLAKLTGAPSTVTVATVSDTTGLVGIVAAGAGTTGNAQVVVAGNVSCEFDGATVAGHYVGASTSTAGKCTDLGATRPTTPVQVIGRVLTTNASATSATVFIFTGEQGSALGISGSGTTNYLTQWTGTSTVAATQAFYDSSGQEFTFSKPINIITGATGAGLLFDLDQVVINGSATRATTADVIKLKAVASQTGDFIEADNSGGSAVFKIRSNGQPTFGSLNYTFPSYPASTLCLQMSTTGVISTVSCQATNIVQAYNVLVDGGCDNTGVTDATTCVTTALAAAIASSRPLYFPAGTYKTNITINGTNSLRIFGDGPGRSIIQSATGGSAVLYANNSTGLTHSLTIEELSLAGFGSGATDHGFYMTPDQPFDLTLRNLRITNTNGNGVYIPTNAFTMLFDGVDVSSVGGNGFDVYGDNTITFLRTYVHTVGSGKTAYRLHSGRFSLIGTNGIDSGTSASWGLFGDTTAEDGADAYARVALKGSNVEAWTSTSYGVRVKTGSQMSVENTHFITGTSITTSAILFDDADPNLDGSYVGRLDGLSAFTLGAGSAWTNTYPIRSKGIPFLMDGNRTASYYDTTLAAAVLMPYQTVALNGASFRGATKFNRLALGTSTNEGFDGNLNFIDDNARDIGTSSAGRPANVYVGTKIQMATGTTTVQGQNWTITGGASPSLAFNDGSITSRFQSLTGTGLQFGTTSAHPVNVLTNGTVTWAWESGGDFIVNSGSHNIGKAAGNRPVIGYFSTSVNLGTPAVSTGSIVFGNVSNSFTTTIQSGVSAASRTYTWPTNFGAAGAVLTDAAGNGTLSWAAVSAAAGGSNTQLQYNNAGALAGSSGVTSDGTNVTAGSGNFRATRPRVTTSIDDANGAQSLLLTATASAVNQFTVVSAATTGHPSLTASGSDSNINVVLTPKGTGTVSSPATYFDLTANTAAAAFRAGEASGGGVGAIHPGTGGGFSMPFIGGGQSGGPGIWWTNNAYNATNGIWLSNGFNFQGASSTHSPLKIRTGTGTSSDGTIRFTFAPDSSLFTQNASTGSTGTTADVEVVDILSTGTAGANFGAARLYTLENGSGSQTNAARLGVSWTTATAAAETSRFDFSTNLAGAGLGTVFSIEGNQYYGTLSTTGSLSGGITINALNGNVQQLTLTGNVTSTTLSNFRSGGIYVLDFIQGNVGSNTLSSTNIKVEGGSLTLTATVGAHDVFQCYSNGTNLYCSKALDVK